MLNLLQSVASEWNSVLFLPNQGTAGSPGSEITQEITLAAKLMKTAQERKEANKYRGW
jgi:hypothetical protein